MFESGYARGVNTALGALDGMSWPGDLSPSLTYLEDDLVPDGSRHDDGSDGHYTRPLCAVPDGPGMGPPPPPRPWPATAPSARWSGVNRGDRTDPGRHPVDGSRPANSDGSTPAETPNHSP